MGYIAGLAALALVGCDGSGQTDGTAEPIRGAAFLGTLGNAPGAFAYPRAMDHDQSGLWVVDRSARVQKIDPDTGECLSWFMMPESELGKPVGITVAPGPDGGDLLYIADTHYSRVMIFRPPTELAGGGSTPSEPELVATFGEYGTGDGQFIYPTDIGVLLSEDGTRMERLYVSEYGGNDRVSVFDAQYRYLFSFGRFGLGDEAGEAQFQRPQSVVVDQPAAGSGGGTQTQARVYVVDSRNHRIGRFTTAGELEGWIGSVETAGRGLGSFKYPYGISLLGDGTAMVIEYGNNRAQRVDLATGEGLATWGQPGRAEGQLAAPWAITTMDGRAFVLDSGNHRVVAFPAPRRRGSRG